MRTYEPLTDEQWQALEPFFPNPPKRGRGKPHTPWRAVMNSILFIFCTNGKWSAIPKNESFGSKSAAHRWYIAWKKTGLLDQILATLKSLHPETPIEVPPLRAPYIRLTPTQPAVSL